MLGESGGQFDAIMGEGWPWGRRIGGGAPSAQGSQDGGGSSINASCVVGFERRLEPRSALPCLASEMLSLGESLAGDADTVIGLVASLDSLLQIAAQIGLGGRRETRPMIFAGQLQFPQPVAVGFNKRCGSTISDGAVSGISA